MCRGSSSLLLFTKVNNAAIAQLVEHNLAKVGVASSSLVCRSSIVYGYFKLSLFSLILIVFVGEVAELVDALL